MMDIESDLSVDQNTAESGTVDTQQETQAENLSPRDIVRREFDRAETSADDGDERTQAERRRDEAGRFAKAEAESAQQGKKPDAAAAKPSTESGTPETEAQTAASTPAVEPPVSWSPEAKAEWTKLSPATQTAVLKREDEVSKGFKDYSEKLKGWEPVEQILAPRREIWSGMGVQSDAQAIGQLVQFWEAYETNAPALLVHLAKHKGINLNELAKVAAEGEARPAQPAQPSVDPRLIQHINTTHQTVEELREQYETDRIWASLERWANDPQNPKPYFSRVQVQMGKLLDAGLAENLDGAYEQAIRLDPSIQAEVEQDRQKQQQEEQAQKAKQEHQQRARVAGSSVRGNSPNGSTKPDRFSGMDVRELVRTIADGDANRL